MWMQLVLLIGWFAVLGIAARRVIRSLVIIGKRMRVSSFVLGFVILGIFTSVPEMLVAANAAIAKTPTLSIGNLIGASFVLLSLVAGLSVIWNRRTCILCLVRKRELFWFSVIVLLPVLLGLDGTLSVFDGFVLVGLFVVYILSMLFTGSAHTTQDDITTKQLHRAIATFIIGTIFLLIAAHYIVDIGSVLAVRVGVSPLFIGLFVFSLGTSLPELALSYTSRTQAQKRFVFGDILGSAAANTCIIGLLGMFGPVFIFDRTSFFIASAFLFVALMLFIRFSVSKRSIGIREGIILVGLHALFLVALVFSGVYLQ